MKKSAFLFLATIYCVLTTAAFAYTSPGKPTGFVNDFAKLLQPETVSSLNQTLSDFERTTGDEISVVTIPTLGDETIETYAEKLFQEWGIGKAKQDNGLLLLIAPAEHEMRIEVGYGLEPYVTDIASGRIIRETLTPAFQRGDYDAGVTEAVTQITGLLNGQELPAPPSPPGIDWAGMGPYIFFVLVYGSSILARSKSWWAGGVVGGLVGAILFSTILSTVLCVIMGLIFDYLVSKTYTKHKSAGTVPPWWIGGGGMGGRGGSGGGFGGFGGGSSGGGGASGRW